MAQIARSGARGPWDLERLAPVERAHTAVLGCFTKLVGGGGSFSGARGVWYTPWVRWSKSLVLKKVSRVFAWFPRDEAAGIQRKISLPISHSFLQFHQLV